MGDMAEVFSGMKEHRKTQRAEREGLNAERLAALGVTAVKQGTGVWRAEGPRGAVMYYPGTNCWQYRGRTMRGSVEQFADWYKELILEG